VTNLRGIATLIFTRYVFPFEVTAALLITAALGAMVLAHRERTTPKPTQQELSRQRIAGAHPTPLPGPGVYARHNAVDFPALLPDGSPSVLSVSPIIAQRASESEGGLPAPPGSAVPLPPGNGESAGADDGGERESAGTASASTGPSGTEPGEARP
jgi:NADH-quinone oxidoreductase subunit J